MDKYFLAGLISGTSQVISGHPFDTLKVNLQNNNLKHFNLNYKNLYKGISYPLITNSLLVSIQFGVYNKFKNNGYNEIISSGSAGLVTGIISSPLDRFKIKRQLLSNEIYNKPFKGVHLTIYREVPANIIYFNTYKFMRDNQFNILVSGGTAGILSWLFTYPIDVIKTRIQSDKYSSIKDAINKKNLYNGLSPCLVRALIVNSIGFYVYEKSIKLFDDI
jgi:solute carrier family 25 (mitochondrial carnitine/acylcarnitine transporter), member 20/29